MAKPTFFIKKGDDTPTLDVALQDNKGRRVNIAGATTVFHMRNSADETVKISSGAVSVLSSSSGEVRYSWTTSNTNTAGNFQGEFQVTFSGGAIQTFPNDEYIDIIITDDIV
jgi:hypothetical protein